MSILNTFPEIGSRPELLHFLSLILKFIIIFAEFHMKFNRFQL